MNLRTVSRSLLASQARAAAGVRFLFAALVASLALAGCGSMHVSRHARLRIEDTQEPVQFDEGVIRTAFEARPQLPSRVRVAFYSVDADAARTAAVRERLQSLPRVESVYEIPALLAAGRRRFDDPDVAPASAPSLRTLRVLAARAHCELLLVFDHATRSETRPNGFAVLNVLLVPAFFAPYLDARDESYLDVYAFDTRNGYLYTQASASREARRPRQTIWSAEDRTLLDQQWGSLLEQTSTTLATWLRADLAEHPEPAPVSSVAAAVAAPSEPAAAPSSAPAPLMGARRPVRPAR